MPQLTQKQLDYQNVMIIRNTINALYTAHTISRKPLAELVALARQGRRKYTCKREDDGRIPFIDNGIPVTSSTSVELPDLALWDTAIKELGL
ncbi:hypothetical protein [Bifidobacterium sp. SO1]|uniref:hypothetical protein n=1 Tax=Bifidobacterium sp. SO1 TaxID=2809029 RepID=UPI001BDCF45D|nr:hypothetical protein [Bifidobacterium sp. SO1]MBT1161244.1 hypothetical protein [Bifidobacterium sp. SO1]